MKTFKKVICVILSVLMAMSCFSAAAFAADAENEPQFTDSFKYYTDKADSYGTDKLLDLADALLKELNFKKEVDLSVAKITIDLTSVNGLCDTIDLIQSLWDLLDSETIVGDLWELNLDVWKSGMSRGNQDETIIKELLEFLGTSEKKKVLEGLKYVEVDHTNAQVIAGLLDGSADLGLLNNFFSIEDILGEGGIEAMLKEMLLDDDYEAYKNDVDGFVYSKIDELAAEYLPGFTMDENSTVEDLICLVFDLVFEQYIAPALKKISIDLSANENEQLRALAGVVNLNGSTYNFDNVNFSSDASFLSQINNIVGKIFTQIVPGCSWIEGDYTKISANIEGACKYIGKTTGIIPDADTMDLDGIVKAVIAIVVQNVDFGSYDDGVTECKTIEDMLKVVLVNASDELGIGVTYDENDTYLVVLGDIVAYYAYNLIDLEDTSGKDYQAGGGKDIFTVVNYIANYFLFDKGVADLLGLSVKKTNSIFAKADKLLDYFGANKSTNFDTETFILGNGSDKKGLLNSIFSLDIQNVIEITAVPALNAAGDVSLVEFLYKSVQYFANNWAGKTVLPAYQSGKAFTNALSNKNIGNMISALLSVINARSDELITLIATAMSVVSSYKVTALIYAVIDFVKNDSAEAIDKVKEEIGDLGGLFDTVKGFLESNVGTLDKIKPYIDVIAETNPNSYAVTEVKLEDFHCNGEKATPTAVVKVGTKTLVQGKDYVVKTDASEIGAQTATIEGIGYYEGSFTVPFNIVLGKVSEVKAERTSSEITLTWQPVVSADSYNVYMLKGDKYVSVQSSAETTYKAENLEPGTDYSFKIEAVSTVHGVGEAAIFDSFTRPEAVDSKTVKATSTDTTITLKWTAPEGATGYRIDRLSGGSWKKVAVVTKTTATIKKLNEYTEYTFRIRSYARDKDGDLVYGDNSEMFTAKTKVADITKLKATTTSNSITLSWNKADNVKGYQIQQKKGSKWSTVTTIKKASTTSYKISKLSAGKKYQFRVRAYNGKSYGEWETITVYTNLVKAKNLKISKVTTSSVTLKWDKVSGADGYVVYRYKSGEWVKAATVSKNTAKISKLSAGKTYKFMVKAYKKSSGTTVYGESSSTLSAKTALGKVKDLKASSRKRSSITLKWDKVTGATGYQVYRYNGSKWVKIATVKSNSYTNSDLKRNTQYQYKVRAYGTVNGKTSYGSYSSTLKAKTTIF